MWHYSFHLAPFAIGFAVSVTASTQLHTLRSFPENIRVRVRAPPTLA